LGTLSTKHSSACAFAILVTVALVPNSSPQTSAIFPAEGGSSSLSAVQVVDRMVLQNESRAAALQGYTARRIYHLNYHGLPKNTDAELIVAACYRAPSTKEFTVISQSGSKMIVDKVLKRLLKEEEEAQNSATRQQTALIPQNYDFELAGEEKKDGENFYILKVQPKLRNKFLYRGEIWVDASDFAIARIEAEPAQNPSFWISHAQIEQTYAKFGSFWLPVRNQSTSKVRLGGTATLVIEYENYALDNDTHGKTQAALAETGKTF
jgi:hypothetical protein